MDLLIDRFNYVAYVILMMIGLHAMIVKKNLIKKLIGMSIFQTAIILFFVSIGVKEGSTIPIAAHHDDHADKHAAPAHDDHHGEKKHHEELHAIDPDDFANPLPHVLMLTAIVVGVATLGLGLAITQKIYRQYGSIEEDEILEKIRSKDV